MEKTYKILNMNYKNLNDNYQDDKEKLMQKIDLENKWQKRIKFGYMIF